MVAGRYRLDKMIGHGSTGSVWAATDQLLRRRVALKKINIPRGMPPAEADELRERTLREARAAAGLSNPHVVTVFDVLAATDTGPVIVMELLQGRSLDHIIREAGRLTPAQAATVGVAVSSALLGAHAGGITHRDVKPSNIFVGDDGLIKLTDFGIARNSEEHTLTGAGMIVGSPAHIAPEIVNGSPAGPASDAWSLGGTLFACVEGRPPFDQGSPIATVASVVNDPVPPHLHSGPLAPVIAGLLVKSPSLRLSVRHALTMLRVTAGDPSGINAALPGRSGSAGLAPGPGPAPPPAAHHDEPTIPGG
jgi:serine/threonine protein kinase